MRRTPFASLTPAPSTVSCVPLTRNLSPADPSPSPWPGVATPLRGNSMPHCCASARRHYNTICRLSLFKNVLGFTPRRRPCKACPSQNDDFLPRSGIHPLWKAFQGTSIPKRFGTTLFRHLCGRCGVQISLDQNHLPRSSASQCTVLGVGVEGAAKSLHLPRLHALQVTPAGVSVEGDFD